MSMIGPSQWGRTKAWVVAGLDWARALFETVAAATAPADMARKCRRVMADGDVIAKCYPPLLPQVSRSMPLSGTENKLLDRAGISIYSENRCSSHGMTRTVSM